MTEAGGHGRSVERFAPYPVWMTLRIVTMIGGVMALLWLGQAIAVLFAAVDGETRELWPTWVFIVGVIVGGSNNNFRRSENLPPFGEIIGRLLASKQCPACGQSIFDHTPPSGYAPDEQTYRWWPSRFCRNCGHDMNVRTSNDR